MGKGMQAIWITIPKYTIGSYAKIETRGSFGMRDVEGRWETRL